MLFSGGDITTLRESDIDELAMELPVAEPGSLINILVWGGAAKSNGEARRLMQSGAVSINGQKVTDDTQVAAPSLVKKGKNVFILVR